MNEAVYEIPGEMAMFVMIPVIELIESLASNAHLYAAKGSVNASRAGHLYDSAAALLYQAVRMNAQWSEGPGNALSQALLNHGDGEDAIDPYAKAAQLLRGLKGIAWDMHPGVNAP